MRSASRCWVRSDMLRSIRNDNEEDKRMSAVMMDGRAVAKVWKEKIAKQTESLISKGITPHLAVVLVGENPASQVYVRNK